MEISILKISGEETGKKIKLDDAVFNLEQPNDHAIYLDVKQYLMHQRQGTHKSKERAEVKYSTRKIKKQKGTGTARAGSIKSPIFVGGGRAFGPRPKVYHIKLNKRVKQLARKSALSYKAKENKTMVVEDFKFDNPKTKEVVNMMKSLKLENKVIFVIHQPETNFSMSVRNLPRTEVILANNLNTYSIMNAKQIVLTESSIATIESILK